MHFVNIFSQLLVLLFSKVDGPFVLVRFGATALISTKIPAISPTIVQHQCKFQHREKGKQHLHDLYNYKDSFNFVSTLGRVSQIPRAHRPHFESHWSTANKYNPYYLVQALERPNRNLFPKCEMLTSFSAKMIQKAQKKYYALKSVF